MIRKNYNNGTIKHHSYDAESGFYYLQSRYYDPSIGRFINADAAEFTTLLAISLSDTNLFAYCRNNPIYNADFDGHRLISLDIMRLIHNEVAKRVAKEINGKEGLYVKKVTSDGKVKRGFLDVYDAKTNSYYEIKSLAASNTSRTKRQMEKYDGSEPVFNSQGPISRGKARVSGAFSYLIYDVRYYSVADGLVVYEAEINTERVMAGVTSAVMVGLGIIATVFTGSPGLIPA